MTNIGKWRPRAAKGIGAAGRFFRAVRESSILLIALLIVAATNPVSPAPASESEAAVAYAFKMAGDANRMRLVVRFDIEPEMNWFSLKAPYRLIIDLPKTRFGFAPDALKSRGMVTSIRYGQIDDERSRVIVALDAAFEVENVRIVRNENTRGYRAIFDIVSTSERRFAEILADQMQTTGATSAPKSDRLGKARKVVRPFTIVVDPGHGGIDGGAKGVAGSLEKTITLNFATELRNVLQSSDNIRVYLTREDDRFLRLDERVRIARQYEADLFVSLHADKVRQKYVRGATVYTLSDKASDAVSHALAESENKADAIAGVELPEEDPVVTDILIDLVHRETHAFSIRLAKKLVGHLSSSVEMINNPHRSAGFRVLRAHDVPSVLIELGYLSNPRDEKLMNDPKWQKVASEAIAAALREYRDKVVSVGSR